MHLQGSSLYDLDLGVKVTQNVALYPPHHKSYAPTKFEVAMSNGRRTDFGTKLIYPISLTKKRV